MYDGSVATAVTIITVLGDGIGKAKGKLTWRKQAISLIDGVLSVIAMFRCAVKRRWSTAGRRPARELDRSTR